MLRPPRATAPSSCSGQRLAPLSAESTETWRTPRTRAEAAASNRSSGGHNTPPAFGAQPQLSSMQTRPTGHRRPGRVPPRLSQSWAASVPRGGRAVRVLVHRCHPRQSSRCRPRSRSSADSTHEPRLLWRRATRARAPLPRFATKRTHRGPDSSARKTRCLPDQA